jgi:uncharacterized membrane protein YcaP (DUF421 family)
MLDWERILFNDQPWSFMLEVALRSIVMFFVLLVALKLAGKRSIKQLSIFELVIIISLGSAAGDPMFYEDVGVLHGILVLLLVLLLYRALTYVTGKSPKIEKLIEGEPECLLSEGMLTRHQFEKDNLGRDEFFSTLRVRNVEHLGQVKKAYLETSGDVSVFFYTDDEIKPGLPILPELLKVNLKTVEQPATYACCHCGFTAPLNQGIHSCERCTKSLWVKTLTTKRIS